MLSILGVAILGLALVGGTTTAGSSRNNASLRAIDGALEEAVQSVRGDDGTNGACPTEFGPVSIPGSATEDIWVTCAAWTDSTGNPAPATNPPTRVLQLEARRGAIAEPAAGGGRVGVGVGIVRITDGQGTQSIPGFAIEVCDWRLGRNATANGECSG